MFISCRMPLAAYWGHRDPRSFIGEVGGAFLSCRVSSSWWVYRPTGCERPSNSQLHCTNGLICTSTAVFRVPTALRIFLCVAPGV